MARPTPKPKIARRPPKPKAKGAAEAKPTEPHTSGTGFLVSALGHIITNYHVSESGHALHVMLGQRRVRAELIKVDRLNDLALLQIKGRFTPLSIGNSKKVLLGATVHAIGFPQYQLQGRKPKYNQGSISSTSGLQDDDRHFQISIPVQPGNSGGPVFDDLGNVIGVVVSKLKGSENVNYAIKSELVLKLMAKAGLKQAELPKKSQASRHMATEVIPEITAGTFQILVSDLYV